MVALVSREKWLLFPPPPSFPTFCGEIKGMRWMVSVAVLFRDKLVEMFPLKHVFQYLFGCYSSFKYRINNNNRS